MLIHALRFSFSFGASKNHDSPCKIYPVTFLHISDSQSSFCNSGSESMRHKRLDLRSEWPNPRSCFRMHYSYRCNYYRSATRRRGGGDLRRSQGGFRKCCIGNSQYAIGCPLQNVQYTGIATKWSLSRVQHTKFKGLPFIENL